MAATETEPKTRPPQPEVLAFTHSTLRRVQITICSGGFEFTRDVDLAQVGGLIWNKRKKPRNPKKKPKLPGSPKSGGNLVCQPRPKDDDGTCCYWSTSQGKWVCVSDFDE